MLDKGSTLPLKKFRKLNVVQLLLSVLITSALGVIIFLYVPLDDLTRKIITISPLLLLLTTSMLVLLYISKTLRMYLLLNKRVSLKELYHITTAHNMLVQLLPFRLGELSFLYFIKKREKSNITMTESVVALTSVRILDVITIMTILLLSLFLIDKASAPVSLNFLFLLALLLLLFFISLFLYSRNMARIHHFLQTEKIVSQRVSSFITERVEKAFLLLKTLQHPKKIFLLILFSASVWLFYYAMMYIIYSSLGMEITFSTFLFIASTAVLFALIPLQGFAGFGNVEVTWTLLFISFGMTKGTALEIAFVGHLIGIFCTILLGIISLLYLFFSKNENDSL